MSAVTIARESPQQPEVAALVAALDDFHAGLYPAESNHALDLSALAWPGATFLVARRDGRAIGCAAVVTDPRGWGEIKRMYVAPEARGLGIGRRLLAALEDAARDDGLRVLRLETGIHNAEALAAYRRASFSETVPFGDYAADPLSVFMEKRLT